MRLLRDDAGADAGDFAALNRATAEAGPGEEEISAPDLAIVVFSGVASLAWLRVLRPGFRHCFALLRSKGEWLYYDPMSHYTFTGVIGAYPVLPLLRVFRARGMRALLVRPDRPPRIAQAWRFYTCVEAVKRVLGLQEPWVLTPWQLYRRLARRRAGRVSRRIP